MYNILVYLFENYANASLAPEPQLLMQELSTEGFAEDAIQNALGWLASVHHLVEENRPQIALHSDSMRIFHEVEANFITPECRSFLLFMENAGVLDPLSRELVIECAMNIPDDELSLAKFKVIVLMVLWKLDYPMNALLSDELLTLPEQHDDDDSEFASEISETAH